MKKALFLYMMVCLVTVGIIVGATFVGVPAKAESSERLLFFCLGFIAPLFFVMLQDYPHQDTYETRSSDNNGGERKP